MDDPQKITVTLDGDDKVTFERNGDLEAGDSYNVMVNGKVAGTIDNKTTLVVDGKGGRDAVIALHSGMSDPNDLTPRIEMNTEEPTVVVGGPFIVAKESTQAAAIPVTPEADQNKTVTQSDGTQITYKDLENSERTVTMENGAKGVEFFDPEAKEKSLSKVTAQASDQTQAPPELTEKQQQIHDNDFFIGRREVMFEAIKEYNGQSHAGQTDQQKLDALTLSIDKAAIRNQHLTEEDKAKVSLEWKTSVREHDTKDVLNFANDVKPLTDKEMPFLKPGSDFGTDLRTASITNTESLIAIAAHTTPEVQANLKELAGMNKKFEEAAEKNHLINYSKGENLTKKFDALDKDLEKTPEKLTEQQKHLQQLQQEMQQEQKQREEQQKQKKSEEEGQDKEDDGKGVAKGIGIGALLMGLFSALKGGLGGLMTLIMGLVAGIFLSKGFSGNDENQERSQQQGQDKEHDRERSRTPVKDLAGKLTELGKDENFPKDKFDLDKDGKVSMTEKLDRDHNGKLSIKEGEDAIGFKIDKDGDGKIDDKEMRALNHRLKGVIEKHPELKEISESFKKEMGKIAAGTSVKDAEQQRGAAAQEASQSRG